MLMYRLQILYSYRPDSWEVWKASNSFYVRKICNGVASSCEKFVSADKPKSVAHSQSEAAFMLNPGDVVINIAWCSENFHLNYVYSQKFSFQLMILQNFFANLQSKWESILNCLCWLKLDK